MAQNLNNLLSILNTSNLQKTDNKLWDFLHRLLKGTQQINDEITAVSSTISPATTGFVTSTVGGTANTISMFTSIRNIENVTVAGVTNALDLLP